MIILFRTNLIPYILLLTGMSGPVTAFSGDVIERNPCPGLSADAGTLLSSLQSISAQIKTSAECQPLKEKITTLTTLVNEKTWKDAKGQLGSGDIAALTKDQVTALMDQADQVAYAVSDTVDVLSGLNKQCVATKNRIGVLSTLSSVVKDVSGVTALTKGPYGRGVALIGNVLSGVLSGIDRLYKKNHPYQFSDREQEALFLNQFCAFTQAQRDIADFIDLDKREKDLKDLEENYLTGSKVKDLVENCPECAAYKIAFDTKFQADRIIGRIIADANVISVDLAAGQRKTFTRCAEINRAVYSASSDLQQYIQLLKNYKNPLMSPSDQTQVQQVIAGMDALPQIYPNYAACIQMDNQAISIKFNDWIRDDVLALNETLFGQQLVFFKFLANYRYRSPNGDYIANTLDRVLWARLERGKIMKKLLEPNYAFSRERVIEQRVALRKRVVNQLMPQYLRHLRHDHKLQFRCVEREVKRIRSKEQEYFSAQLGQTFTGLNHLGEALKKNPNLARYFVSASDQALFQGRALALGGVNFHLMCEYLVYSRSLTALNRALCDRDRRFEASSPRFLALEPDLKAIADFHIWAEANLKIQSTYVRDYAALIDDWRKQGDSRWQKSELPE
jgi:hypothetical protein